MKIFAGGLPFRMDESSLKEVFQSYGQVSSAKVITDKFTGKSRGFGFIEMPDDAEAKKAIEGLNGSEIDGRSIVVNVAEERKERSGGGGGFRRDNNRGGGGGGGGGGYGRRDDNRGNRREY